MRILPVAFAGLLFALTGDGYTGEPQQVTVKIVNAKQQDIGEATLNSTPDAVLVRISLKQNLPGISLGHSRDPYSRGRQMQATIQNGRRPLQSAEQETWLSEQRRSSH